MPFHLLATAVSLSALSQAPSSGNLPFVSQLFSSDMVLQRDQNDAIWGWTTPGSKVSVSIGGKTASATADSTGKWMAKLPKFGAGGNYTLSVTGPQTASFSNVTFGDVWICSGQSNMEFGVGNLLNPQETISAANYPNIRLYYQPHLVALQPTPGVGGTWTTCTPENIVKQGGWGGFSAVGYFFGKKLNTDLNIPIGLVFSSWGGTIAEAWTSKQWLEKKNPEFDPAIKGLDAEAAMLGSGKSYDQLMTDWYAKYDQGSGAQSWAAPDLDDSNWHTGHVPGNFQNLGFPDLVNNASVVWYRKVIELPDTVAGKSADLKLQVDDNDLTFVNGVAVGATNGVFNPRDYAVKEGILHPGKNVIAVRVTDTGQPGGIMGKVTTLTVNGDSPISLEGDWKLKLSTVIDGSKPFPQDLQNNPNQPTVLYNGMIDPIVPFGVKGAIWYQGESNAGRGIQYRTLMATLIESWRDAFGQGAFPFYEVQLAGFQHAPQEPGDDDQTGWAGLREAQMIAAKSIPNADLATAIDIGEENDIHPKNKQEVGRRLALIAESKTYGKHLIDSGPVYKSVKVEGANVVISFDKAAGLKTSDGNAVKGFAIAGDDHKWHWAEAKIDKDKVVVSSSDVPHPVAVRYAWAVYLPLNLQNGEGLPAYPFRTDNWPIH